MKWLIVNFGISTREGVKKNNNKKVDFSSRVKILKLQKLEKSIFFYAFPYLHPSSWESCRFLN